MFFLHFSVENDISIYPHEGITNYEESPLQFPAGWNEAIKAGWTKKGETKPIVIDGIASIVFPVIVPERKLIVDSGTFMLNGKRIINAECFKKVSKLKFKPLQDKKTLLASKSYINSFSHSNTLLQYLGLVTCLEILCDQKEKEDRFKEIVLASQERVDLIETFTEGEAKIIQQIKSSIGKLTKQSISEALESLIQEHKDIISDALPMDNPYKDHPSSAVREIYKVRSKIAHSGGVGSINHLKFSHTFNFAKIAAKTIVKVKLKL